MAFKTVSEKIDEEARIGISLRWENLIYDNCPSCGDELIDFDRINLSKCPCGFKISFTKKRQVQKNLEEEESIGYNSGYRFGNYHDEEPF